MSSEVLFSRPWQRRILVIAAVALLASVVWFAVLLNGLGREDERRLAAARDQAAAQAQQITGAIATRLEAIVPVVEALAADLGSGALMAADVRARLERDFNAHAEADLLEIGVAYASGEPDAPHFGIKDGTARHFQLEESYDYREKDWYRDALDERGHWSEPYFGGATRSWASGYVRAFERDGAVAGVARVNFNLPDLHRMVAIEAPEAMFGATAYALLLSGGDRVIAHPIDELIGRTVAELEARHPILRTVAALSPGQRQAYQDEVTGERYWIFASALPAADWTGAVVFNRREVLERGDAGRHFHEPLLAAAVVLLLALGTIALRAYRGTERAIWRMSIFVACLFAAAIVVIWTINLGGAPRPNGENIRVVDRAAVEALLDARQAPTTAARIPTGVFVQSLRFTSANNVMLTGYVWQRAPDGHPAPGVILPEAEEVAIAPAGEGRWYFETTLRQQFDYSRYPFDREDVWIRLWPGDLRHFRKQVVLVPDFDAYSVRRPVDRPGLEAEFVLEGWDITDSHFSYRENRYNADFGLDADVAGERSVELYFNIGLKRDFLSPFIADFIPIIVVAFLVFKVLMSSTRREAGIGLFGFSASAVLGYCAALFFVLIVAHIHLRETLASSGIIYIEWFYFTMYFAILAVSTNALVFASDTRAPLIHFRDNLLVKQAYWPLLTALLLAVTVIVFH